MSAPLSSNYPRSGRSQSPALALAERASRQDRAEVERLKRVVAAAEAEARRYADSYPQSSDARNTFLMLADRIAELAVGAK